MVEKIVKKLGEDCYHLAIAILVMLFFTFFWLFTKADWCMHQAIWFSGVVGGFLKSVFKKADEDGV